MKSCPVDLTDNQIVLGNTLVAMPPNSPQGIGFELSETELNKAFLKFKDLADKKKEISDDWKRSRMMKSNPAPEIFRLELQVSPAATFVPPQQSPAHPRW